MTTTPAMIEQQINPDVMLNAYMRCKHDGRDRFDSQQLYAFMEHADRCGFPTFADEFELWALQAEREEQEEEDKLAADYQRTMESVSNTY